MPDFPAFSRSYSLDDYSYEVSPDVSRTQYFSGNSRQRKLIENRDDVFSVSLFLSDSELSEFESFIDIDLDGGALTFSGPYYTMSSEQIGELQIINGAYSAENIQNQVWQVSYQFRIFDRDLTAEQSIYDIVSDQGSFDSAKNIFDALADLANNFYE